jgi:hypothetical protein
VDLDRWDDAAPAALRLLVLLPTTTVTTVAPAEAAFRTSSSTARPVEPMTVPARTDRAEEGDSGRIAVKVELRLVLMVRSRRFICERVWTGLFFSRAEAKTPTEQLGYYIISMTIAALRSS